jgi:uncharacterized protein
MRWLLACLAALALPALCAPAADRGPDGLLRVPPLARVVDAGGYLSAADRAALDGKLAAFEARRGSQIAIVLVPSTQPEPIEDYAHRVGEAWKIGRAGTGDGLLIVVAVQDRRARIDVARSLEGAVPDALAGRVVQNQIAPRFAAKDYAGGLEDALDVLFAHISAEGLAPGPGDGALAAGRRRGDEDGRLHPLLPLLFGGAAVGVFLRRLLGVLGALLAAGGAFALAAIVFSSIGLAALAGIGVLVFSLFGGPFFAASQMLGVRGGGYSGGFGGGGGGGGFRSGGGGDFSGGGASGSW